MIFMPKWLRKIQYSIFYLGEAENNRCSVFLNTSHEIKSFLIGWEDWMKKVSNQIVLKTEIAPELLHSYNIPIIYKVSITD